MSTPTGFAVAENAARKALEGTIPYAQQDCQAFVERCVADCGGHMDYAGSNDMFRHTVPVCEIKNGKPLGTLLPGDLLFIHAFDGGEPAKYKGDGLGNASHVGIYCGVNGVEVAHSSASRGRVAPSTLKNAWTHARRAKEIDTGTGGDKPMPQQQKATVIAPDKNPVKLRPTPGTKKPYIAKVPVGAAVEVLETATADDGQQWSVVLAQGKRGYMMTRFLAPEELPSQPEDGDASGMSLHDIHTLLARVALLEALQEELRARLTALEGGQG